MVPPRVQGRAPSLPLPAAGGWLSPGVPGLVGIVRSRRHVASSVSICLSPPFPLVRT